MAATDYISSGNEFGITNVSSQGNVSITVVPPRRASSRARSQPRSLVSDNSSHHSARVTDHTGTLNEYNTTTTTTKTSRSAKAATGHEQNELDEILRELLGAADDSGGAAVTTTTRGGQSRLSKRGNGNTVTISSSTAPGQVEVQGTGSSWLEKQQQKLLERQKSREHDNVAQRHHQQKQLVTELKHVQSRRQESLTDDYNANEIQGYSQGSDGNYKTERDVFMTTSAQEPDAYTVYIKPGEQKKEEVPPQVTKKSVTNVSHTHHTHYNFQDASGDDADIMQRTLADQKQRIAQLEDELKRVKKGLEQPPPPPRPSKLELEEEEEEFLFKPVGIASLESGTGQTTIQSHAVQTPSNYGGAPHVTSPSSYYGHTSTRSQKYTREEQHYQQQSGNMSQSGTLQQQTSLPYSGQQPPPPGFYQPTPTSMPAEFPGGVHTTDGSHQVEITHENGSSVYHNPVNPPQAYTNQAGSLHGYSNQANSFQGYSNPADTYRDVTQAGSGYHANGLTNYSTVGGQLMNGSSDIQAADQMTAKFVKDTSRYWYKPHISREEVTSILKNATPGTFIVRDSNSFPGAFGLAVKVAQLPPNVQIKPNSDPATEYVRFFLIEPTTKGVRLKGCSNEPVFASLASLIYQHTITPLALPCKLLLPDPDQYEFNSLQQQSSTAGGGVDQLDGIPLQSPAGTYDAITNASDLLRQGAVCSMVYMNCVDTESLTGPQAISRALHKTFGKDKMETTIATFKVSNDGITLTDTNRKLFFRNHFPKESISYCGLDPADRRFTQTLENNAQIREAKIFGFVAKKKGGNQCLLFAEYDPEQPATAVVNFVNKVLLHK